MSLQSRPQSPVTFLCRAAYATRGHSGDIPMTFARPKRINGRVPVLTAEEAVKYIPDESTSASSAPAAASLKPRSSSKPLPNAIRPRRRRRTSASSATGLGDRAERGISPIAQEASSSGRSAVTGVSHRASPNWPNKIRFCLQHPQASLTQMLHASAAHQPAF